MSCRLALVAVVIGLIGCENYRSRAQGPFPRQTGTNAVAQVRGTAPGGSPLVLNAPTAPLSPGPPDELLLVPPRPPEPAPVASTVVPPQPPRPPVAAEPEHIVLGSGPAEAPQPFVHFGVQDPAAPGGSAPPAVKPPANAVDSSAPMLPSPQAVNLAALKRIAQTAAEKWKDIDTHEAKFVRRETIDDKVGPTKEVLFQYRKEPMAVYMKNVGEAGKGREVLYNPSKYGDKVHVIIGEGDTRFMKAGSKGPTLSPDSPQIRSKSRHSIREAGLGVSTGKFIAAVARVETGKVPPEALKYAGLVKREEFGDHALEGVESSLRKGEMDGLPGGGVQHWFFDAKPDSPSFGLPILVILYDANGRELEYYRYAQFRAVKLLDADFDPARFGKK